LLFSIDAFEEIFTFNGAHFNGKGFSLDAAEESFVERVAGSETSLNVETGIRHFGLWLKEI